ncbi:hypothetical protein BS47DRAFT_1333634 [Hydnum rufescens UP504]|uniref:CDP-diacylglycerol--glycerol-3-phosphate 3-phosphatidyltransferase n=1 Tax=Hydnum rufescens UP504 TaxID=1448309 RepID=A0A9P6DQN3_9AGAM|nr:hypothetical protein BS47DRAFT_1333634 [Hydnum rufescens UP504]
MQIGLRPLFSRFTCRSLSTNANSGAFIAGSQPRFTTPATSIHVLQQPTEFYNALLSMIRRAKTRLIISSLYVGTEETELLGALHDALSFNPMLTVHMQLDFNRSTREGPGQFRSTAHMLVPLVEKFPDRVSISLYRTPKLKGIMSRIVPARYNEGWGTWHAKIYAADDEVLLSGANLSSSYFTNRQDRYFHLVDQRHLVDYFSAFLRTFSLFAYSLLPPSLSTASSSNNSYSSSDSQYHLSWRHPTAHPRNFEIAAETAIKALQDSHTKPNPRIVSPSVVIPESDPADVEHDTEIYPLIQSGVLGIREEECVLTRLFDHHLESSSQPRASDSGRKKTMIDLTSGYFALYEPYQRRALCPGPHWRIIAASPKANGFYGSKGLSGRIPEGYTMLEQRFWNRVVKAGREWGGGEDQAGGVELGEWEREGWTYHAKGIWISPYGESSSSVGPSTTLFGSTNLNARSANLDTELSFLLRTRSRELQARLGEEVDWLRRDAKRVGEKEWEASGRKIGGTSLGTRAIMALVWRML